MTSSRPYLIRALYDWINDNGLTPLLVADVAASPADIPKSAIDSNGKVTLNIAQQATEGLELGDEWVAFRARFSGRSQQVRLPVTSVLAVYARENGQGMMFPPDEGGPADPDGGGEEDRKRVHLKVIK